MAERKDKAGPQPRGTRRRWFFGVTLALMALGLLLRLVVSAQLAPYSPVRHPAPATDMFTYQTYAQQILKGEYDFRQGFYYQPFYYAVFLPAVYLVAGPGPWGVILAQALLAGFTIWLTALAFARLFGRSTGLVAAGLLALDRLHIFYTPFALLEILQGFWLSLLLYAAVRAFTRRSWWWWGAAGLVAGLANCTRGNIVILLPVVLWLAWRSARSLSLVRQSLLLALILVVFYLPQLPFAWVNYRATGHWVGTSTAAGPVLALGNTPEAPPGGREPGSSGPMCYPETYHAWMAQATAADPAARVSVARNIWRWFVREPLAVIELKFRMLLLFWNKMEIPNNVSIVERGQPVPSPVLHLPVLLDFWLVGGLGLAGLLLGAWRARRRPLVVGAAGLVLFYCFAVVLFYILARFRLPVVPWLCGFAGAAVVMLWRTARWWREPARRRRVVYGAAVLLFSLGFVGFGYNIYRLGWEARVMRLARPHGVRLDLPDRQVVKDHGPYPFGGWALVKLAGLEVTKSFVSRTPLADFRRVVLRVAVLVSEPTDLSLTVLTPGQISPPGSRDFTVAPDPRQPGPETWLQLELPPGSYVYNADGRVSVSFRLDQRRGAEAMTIIDTQRDYGRTQLNAPAPRGELVAELNLYR